MADIMKFYLQAIADFDKGQTLMMKKKKESKCRRRNQEKKMFMKNNDSKMNGHDDDTISIYIYPGDIRIINAFIYSPPG